MTDHQDLPRLRHELEAMSSEAPVVPDWSDRVRRGVRTRRRRNGLAFGALGVVAVLSIGAVGAYALGGTVDDRVTVAAASQDPVGPTPEPGSSCRPQAPRVTPTLPAAKLDKAPVNDIRLTLTPNCTRPRVGEELIVTVTTTGDAATPMITSSYIGGLGSVVSVQCLAPPNPLPPPAPGTLDDTLRHTYTKPGIDRVRVSVSSGCSGYEGAATAELAIEVLPALMTEAPVEAAGPTSTTRGESALYPPSNSQVITIRVSTPEPAVVGRPWPIVVSATGLADREPFLQVRFDDDDKLFGIDCAAPDPSPPPAKVQHTKQEFRHVFQTPGRHEVRIRADSACSYYQGEKTLTVPVDVARADTPASPTP